VLAEQNTSYNLKYNVGDIVSILTAPFEGSEGVVTQINQETAKVTVTVNLLGRETPVELDFSSIRSQ
jgi:transcriptional antiterminator NusG